MADNNNMYNVRNILVSKDKNPDFLDFYRENLIEQCPFKIKPYLSGPYYVYTLDNVHDDERKLIKDHEKEWI